MIFFRELLSGRSTSYFWDLLMNRSNIILRQAAKHPRCLTAETQPQNASYYDQRTGVLSTSLDTIQRHPSSYALSLHIVQTRTHVRGGGGGSGCTLPQSSEKFHIYKKINCTFEKFHFILKLVTILLNGTLLLFIFILHNQKGCFARQKILESEILGRSTPPSKSCVRAWCLIYRISTCVVLFHKKYALM